MRKRYARQVLEQGNLYYPRVSSPWLSELLEEFGLKQFIPYPVDHVTQDQWMQIKAKHKELKRLYRDQFHASLTAKNFNKICAKRALYLVLYR